ncbi:PKD1L2 [Mytilus coruscus]|uniref:PKD1L2 n=1 Tax=Mytilus coruscus TaxID=42192 RepID=A0A6J8B2E2_MYTCO|nr:PKD1L2 [Mytilus coruscus]
MLLWIICTVLVSLVNESNGNPDFATGSQNYITLSPTITSSAINITDTTSNSAHTTIYTNAGNESLSKVVSSNSITFTTTDFSSRSLDYGIYEVGLELSGNGGSLNTAIIYEIPITGFEVIVAPIMAINEEVTFTATFTQASNVEIEWHWNVLSGDTELDDHIGIVSVITKNHTFNTIDDYNITVVAGNSLGRVYQFVQFKTQYNVNGFSVVSNSGPRESGKNTKFDLFLSPTAQEPMGSITITLIYGYQGEETIISVTDSIKTNLSSSVGYERSYTYNVQGNYSVNVSFESEISSQQFFIDQYIWDNLNNVSLNVPDFGNVSEIVSFQFTDVTASGFNYRVLTGDGEEFENDPSFLYSPYSDPMLTHTYNTVGIYTVNMLIWNPFYSTSCTKVIIIQAPIKDMVLTPALTDPSIMYPIPDGIVDFSYSMIVNHPDPTNVTCSNSFHSTMEDEIEETNITYGIPIMKTFTYTNAGNFTVNITCFNEVSRVELITKVEMIIANLNKFSLSYPLVTGMNMTLVPSDDGLSDATFTYDEKNVTFQVELLRCVKFPPGIDIDFDFGDFTATESLKNVTVGTAITHTYRKRGNYTVTIYLSDKNKGTGSNSFNVKMGATDIFIPDYGGRIAVSLFSFTVSGVGPGATYEVTISSSQTYIMTSEPSVKTNIYPTFEKFNPKVIAYNSTFYEITYTEQPVRAEEPMTGVNISLPLKIDLPPGDILVNVSLADGSNSLPFINCTFSMGDLIDRKLYYIYKNLTVSNPYLFYFTYITLGNHSATVNCSNTISYVDYVVTVNVWNECFQPTGMFDRDYSNDTNPLVLYTSQDIDLGSRMAVYCTEQHVTYVWELNTVDVNGTYTIPYAYEPVVPATGIIRFAKGSIEENIYKVTLNVTLDTTWVYEPTFIKFVKPPPFAYILGGNLLSVKLNKVSVKFDAMTGSYDVMYGEGANQNLTFAWTCKRFNTDTLDVLSSNYEAAKQNNQLNTYPDCMDKLEQESNDTNGILIMNLTLQEGYAVSVQVFLDNLISNYTQLLQAREGGAPDVGIMCILNCDRKYATTLKSIYQAICYDCEPGEINDISFQWSLQGINVPPFDFKTMTLTDINTATISIAADKLLKGREYKLWVSASGGWGRTADSTQTGRTLWTNSPPYNGHCIASPTEGNATTTSFSIYCSGFLDEGDNLDQDIVRDKNENNALKYKYFAVDKYINLDGTERLERSVLFSGGEMSATELRLALGSPDLDYSVTLQVEISDIYGDYVTVEMKVKVKPDTSLQPTDAEDTNAVENLFKTFEGTYAITNKGGNKMSVVRIASATSSMYSHVDVKQTSSLNTSTTSPVNIDNNVFLDSSLDTSEDSKVQTMLKEKNQRLMEIINSAIPNSKSPAPLLPDDCQLVAKAVEETLSNTDVVTSSTSIAGFAGSNELMQNVYITTQKHPFQMDQLNSVNTSTSAIVSSLDKNLNFIFVGNRENLQEPLTRAAVEEELRTKYDTYYKDRYETDVGNEDGFQQLVDKVYQQRQFTRKSQEEKSNAASSSTGNFYNTLDTVANVSLHIKQYGEAVTTLEKSNLHMSFEKNSVQSFLDQGNVNRDGVKISTKNLTISNVSDASMQLTVTIVKQSPVPHAKGDNRISSKCVIISAVDADGKDLKMEREAALPNPETVHFMDATSPDPEDPEPMLYFRFEVLDNHDASITYIKLEGDIPEDMYIIYTAYFMSETYPTSTEYDYKYEVTINDMEEMGLKVIAPVGTLKQGQCFLALQPKPHIPDAGNPPQTRRKRSTVNNNGTSPGNTTFDPSTGNISIVTITTGCRSFNQTLSAWEPNGCIVLPFSTLNETVCRCPAKTKTLATTFYVTPNTIDFKNVWGKFDIANAAVYGTLTVLLLLYIILAIWLRRKDKIDKLNWSMRFLCDCDSEDQYFYMISVHTGLRPGSGTDSNVNFVLAGEGGDSGVRLLSDGVEHGFSTASVRKFVMSTNVVLGELTYFRLWHDNTGQGNRNSWYLHKLIVDDPQTNQRYLFQCDKWLSIDFDDGMIERIIPVSITDDIGVESLFYQQSRMNLTENHLWMSLFVRPTRSVFTRVQRLGCGTTLLLLTMISNAMFFRTADEETVQADSVQLGFFRLSMSNLFISFIGILITTPPIFFATFVFRNTEPKTKLLDFQKKTKQRKCLPCLKQNKNDGEKRKEIEPGSSEDEDFLIYKKRKFPYWVSYIAWIVLVLGSVASAFFLLLYSMEWGKNKSEEWLSTFILSFFESIIFVDPIKVILIAFLIALIYKKHVDDETTLVDMKKLRSAASKHSAGNSRLFWGNVFFLKMNRITNCSRSFQLI